MPFLGFVGGLLKPFALKLLIGLAIAGAVAAVLLGARNAGRNAERLRTLEKQLQNVRTRNEVEREVGSLGPDAVRERLRERWTRRDGVRGLEADHAAPRRRAF